MPLIPSLDKPSSRFNPIDLSYVKRKQQQTARISLWRG
nr:MAG TPA: hypothetical protein [Caudoviricetes sp.]